MITKPDIRVYNSGVSKPLLFLNGLGVGDERPWETRAFRILENKGYDPIHGHVNWRTESLDKIFHRLTSQSETIVREVGFLTVVGASAGGSLAINLFGKLRDRNVKAVNAYGRLSRGNLPSWSYHTLEFSAHLGTQKASQSWYESVQYCEDVTIPALSKRDKERISILKPITDLVVPLHTMDIDGIEPKRMLALGHSTAGLAWPHYLD